LEVICLVAGRPSQPHGHDACRPAVVSSALMKLSIEECMAPTPIVIAPDEPSTAARELMAANHVRHLPVVSDEELVGLVSIRDLDLLDQILFDRPVKVRDVMTKEVYAVSPDTNLRTVALQMHARKIGSAVVVDGTKVVGVFTTVDALRVLANTLE